MIGIIFFIALLIFVIIHMVKLIRHNTHFNRMMLLSSSIASVLSTGAYGLFLIKYLDYFGIKWIVYFLGTGLSFIIFTTLLIINIIILICTKKTKQVINEDEELKQNKKWIKYTIIIIIIYILVTALEIVPKQIEKNNDKKRYAEANSYVIKLLEEKYGDGNFKIVESKETNVCDSCSWMSKGTDGYKYTIDTTLMDSNFEVSLVKEDFSIEKDNFLKNYYHEKMQIIDLEEYVIDYKKQQLNELLQTKFNVEIKFNNTSFNNIENIKFEKIPTIDELTQYVNLQDPKIDINEKSIKTKEELEKYLLSLTKFFIEDLKYKDNFSYLQNTSYFRYKFDYSQIGINDYDDQFNGYGGYVMAGISKYDESLGHYVTIDKDKIIRININSKVSQHNLEDILKQK